MDQGDALHLSQAHVTCPYCLKMSLMRPWVLGGGGYPSLYLSKNNIGKGVIKEYRFLNNGYATLQLETLEIHLRDVTTICPNESILRVELLAMQMLWQTRTRSSM